MDRIVLFIIGVFLCSPLASLAQLNQFETLAVKYAVSVGDIELGNIAFDKANRRCQTDFAYPPSFMAETDYYLRKNTGYTYTEFINWLEKEDENNRVATHIVDNLIEEHGGCDPLVLEHWFKYVIRSSQENQLDFFRQNKSLWILPRVTRKHQDVQNLFNQKLNDYYELPYFELFDLASALEHGSYSYSMYSLLQSIPKNHEKAIEIWRFAIDKFNKPQAYFYLAKLLQSRSAKEAFVAFEKSAELGYKYGEIWLGTYYACNKDILKSTYWLNKAKQGFDDPGYIDDIFSEINDLGMPTNCIDGWVY